ncbi:F-box domain [Macleaya cordata]|uniref:F-box domain n=1 Tax=Macleaya cordata TaxID=56857 RepID=A0A200PSJ6_MACCD|nr:F-box domain [Macleaya cordata]
MKLRIRSLESKETLKIQTPSPSSLQDLKNAIVDKISAAASFENLQLSLNRKDKIDASPHDSLQSLGIASGDLIFYTLDPNLFSGNTLTQIPIPREESFRYHVSNPNQTLEQGDSSHFPHNSDFISLKTDETLTLATKEENPNTSNLEKTIEKGESSNLSHNSNFDSGKTEETITLAPEEENMEIPDDENPNVVVEKISSVPCFLKKVLKEEVSNIEGDYKLSIIAVHAVFLESGFVAFDSVKKKKIDGFQLPEGWATKSTTLSVKYTVQDLLGSGSDEVETVSLVFQTLGKFVNVYGSLSRKGKDLYRLCLDKSQFVPSINFVWLNCDSTDAMDLEDESSSNSKSSHESKVFEFWKIAKDGLALPLLIDLCDKTGLASPPCFTLLPTDLKLRILEFLPGVDIARLGCVSSELKYLSSNNDLWKQKVEKEFEQSDIERVQNEHWKERFVACWEVKKRGMLSVRRVLRRPYTSMGRIPDSLLFHLPGRRPLAFPGMIGGDHDLFPVPFGSQRIPRNPARRQFMPGCNLGGFYD